MVVMVSAAVSVSFPGVVRPVPVSVGGALRGAVPALVSVVSVVSSGAVPLALTLSLSTTLSVKALSVSVPGPRPLLVTPGAALEALLVLFFGHRLRVALQGVLDLAASFE